jgi:hypothetical protein
MATRSTIALDTPQGIRAVYCHWDGYLEGVGKTLKSFYSTFELVESLIEKGDLSSLGQTLEESQFYADLGEELKTATFQSDVEWLLWADNCSCEFAYLFRDGKWIQEAI